MNSSRYSDNNSNAYSSYNMNNLGQSGVGNDNGNGNGNMLPKNYNYSQSNTGFYGHANMEKAYTIINTEPVYVKSDEPIILVDPIMERYEKSYLTFSLINAVLCCCIGGIITTILSCNVMRLNDNKMYDEARKWSWRVLLANMIITGIGAFTWYIVFPYIYVAIYPSLPKINW